jgi:hypothetical protein
MPLKEKMDDAWNLLENRLFCDNTNLVYDSLSSHDPERRFRHLPFPEEIAKHIPNPAGWGTGMEDCMLNAGSVLEACVIRARLEPERREAALALARKTIAGMEACATLHGMPGYVVRGISPRDGKSCYINSSRDQFTLFVYGLWRFFRCEFANGADRSRIAGLLRAVADYCERVVGPENEDNLLRLDGKPGMVCQMTGVAPHEEFRLPMFYLAAWDVSRERRYLDLYERYAAPALDVTSGMDRGKLWWNLELVQMQISLALAADVDPVSERAGEIRRLMRLVAELSESSFYREEPKMLGFKGTWSQVAVPWHGAWKMSLRQESVHEDAPSLYHGLLYLKPWEDEAFMAAFEIMRAIGNLGVAVALCRERRPSDEFRARFEKAASVPDYASHTSGGVCNMLHGYYLLRSA